MSGRAVTALAAALFIICIPREPISAGTGDTASPQSRQTPVFRGGAILVPVDVRVVDNLGHPVTDLKQGDFTVLENGVRQEIRHFSTQAFIADPAATAADQRLLARPSLRAELTTQTRRIFLIMFGRGRLQAPGFAVDAAIQFVRQDLLPQDAVGVFFHDRATDFTTDHEQIAQLLERFRTNYTKVESQLESWISSPGAVYGSAGIPPRIQQDIDAIFAGAPGVREVAPSAGRDINQVTRDLGDTLNATPFDQNFGDFVSDLRQTMQDYGSLYTGIDYLRRLDGEKHLIFVSEQGLNLPRADDDRGIAADANDARVVIDTILAGGLGDNAPPPTANGRPTTVPTQLPKFFKNASLSTYADYTGGIASGHTLAAKALARINDATLFGYLLGYYPTDTTLNGRYRRIEVKVNRPDVTVYFRHGYYAEDSITPFNREVMITSSRMSLAASFEKEIHDIGIHVSAGFTKGSGNGGQVGVIATIDVSKVGFTTVAGRHVASLQTLVFCANSEQELGRKQQVLNLNLDDAGLEKLRTSGLAFNPTFEAASRPSLVKVVVYDYAADLVGTAIVKLR